MKQIPVTQQVCPIVLHNYLNFITAPEQWSSKGLIPAGCTSTSFSEPSNSSATFKTHAPQTPVQSAPSNVLECTQSFSLPGICPPSASKFRLHFSCFLPPSGLGAPARAWGSRTNMRLPEHQRAPTLQVWAFKPPTDGRSSIQTLCASLRKQVGRRRQGLTGVISGAFLAPSELLSPGLSPCLCL